MTGDLMTAVPVLPGWKCSDCGLMRSKPAKRMPMGWKRQAEDLYCPDCWRKRYILRAVTMAVAAPDEGATWENLRAALHSVWRLTTQASNWILTELYARDVRRGDEEKMPPMTASYLYPEIRARFPLMPSQACAALEKAVTAKYRAKRYEVIWTCGAALPTHRYPTPYPVPNQAWSVVMEEEQPVVSFPVSGDRIRLRLRGGARYRRQLAAVRQIVAGKAEKGQMDIYSQGKDILVKMVAWLPRETSVHADDSVLLVRTSAESLIAALNVKDAVLWTYNGDQIRRWSAEHRKKVHRWSEDSKAEHRPVPPFAERRKQAAAKFHDRMAAACHQIAAMTVNYAVRRKFAAVRYDDRIHDFCPDFTWFALADKIAEKCDAAGIGFERISGASGEAVKETGEPLAEE